MISLYSGIGGLDYGFAQHGYQILVTAETDQHAVATHHHWLTHFQDVMPHHYDDVLELLADVQSGTLELPAIDLIAGGPHARDSPAEEHKTQTTHALPMCTCSWTWWKQ